MTNSLSKIKEEDRQAMLAAIIDSSHDAIISKTLDGLITSWNTSAQKLFGYHEDEVIGKHISILIPTDRLDEENVIISKISKGEKVDHFETIRKTKTGQQLAISLTISPILGAGGRVIGASKIARDITEQQEIRRKLKEYAEELEKVNSYKDEFIGMASHELKTPLTSLTGYLQLLQRMVHDDKAQLFVGKAAAQANKLTALIADLLDISKIQSGQLPLNFETFDFDELVAENVFNIRQITGTHDIIFERGAATKLINADKQRVEQVIINLLTNAVKYSPLANKVIVKTCATGNKVQLTVQDFGIGIDKSQQEKIFSRYYRVQDNSPSFSGLGIGLYITAGIVKRHKGELWVESELGQGSTFYIELPTKL